MNLLLLLVLAAAPAPTFVVLPGGPPVSMDYLAYDPAGDRVWAPAGNTGKVDVVEARSGVVHSIDGFRVATVKGRDGRDRVIGPSSVTIGDGFAYVGNRADSRVCAVDARTLLLKGCVALPSPPDGVAWVPATHEVWVTTPVDGSVTILDAKDPSHPKLAGRIPIAHPEGYAVDADRGLFYTNQEEEDRTLAIDVRGRKVVATWHPGCGEQGPRGLALDPGRRHLFVACTGSVKVLDAGGGGALLGQIATGEGVDNIDYLPSIHRLYAAAGRAGTLTVADVDDRGVPTRAWSAPAAEGGRVVVVDSRGAAFVADSRGGRLVVFR